MDSGRDAGDYPTASLEEFVEAARSGQAAALDVRQLREWDAGHVSGSVHTFVGDLSRRIEEVPSDQDVIVACASGFRASIGASLLSRAGRPVRLVAHGGVPDVVRART